MEPEKVSVSEIAKALGLSTRKAWTFAERLPSQYLDLPKRWVGSKHRPLVDMRHDAKARLKQLHDFIQSKRLYHRFAQGSIRKRGCVRSARIHAGRPHVWTVDAKNCFPSVSRNHFEKELLLIGFDPDVVSILCLLSLRGDGVP